MKDICGLPVLAKGLDSQGNEGSGSRLQKNGVWCRGGGGGGGGSSYNAERVRGLESPWLRATGTRGNAKLGAVWCEGFAT